MKTKKILVMISELDLQAGKMNVDMCPMTEQHFVRLLTMIKRKMKDGHWENIVLRAWSDTYIFVDNFRTITVVVQK